MVTPRKADIAYKVVVLPTPEDAETQANLCSNALACVSGHHGVTGAISASLGLVQTLLALLATSIDL